MGPYTLLPESFCSCASQKDMRGLCHHRTSPRAPKCSHLALGCSLSFLDLFCLPRLFLHPILGKEWDPEPVPRWVPIHNPKSLFSLISPASAHHRCAGCPKHRSSNRQSKGRAQSVTVLRGRTGCGTSVTCPTHPGAKRQSLWMLFRPQEALT